MMPGDVMSGPRLTQQRKPLTEHQRRILELHDRGLTVREIADEVIGVDEHRELMRRSLADDQLDLEAEWEAAR